MPFLVSVSAFVASLVLRILGTAEIYIGVSSGLVSGPRRSPLAFIPMTIPSLG